MSGDFVVRKHILRQLNAEGVRIFYFVVYLLASQLAKKQQM